MSFVEENSLYIGALKKIIDSGETLREGYNERVAKKLESTNGYIPHTPAEGVAFSQLENATFLIKQLKDKSIDKIYDELFKQRIEEYENDKNTYETSFKLDLLKSVGIFPDNYDFSEFREYLEEVKQTNRSGIISYTNKSRMLRNYEPTPYEYNATTNTEAITLIEGRMDIYTPSQILEQFKGIPRKLEKLDHIPFILNKDHYISGTTIIENFGYGQDSIGSSAKLPRSNK